MGLNLPSATQGPDVTARPLKPGDENDVSAKVDDQLAKIN